MREDKKKRFRPMGSIKSVVDKADLKTESESSESSDDNNIKQDSNVKENINNDNLLNMDENEIIKQNPKDKVSKYDSELKLKKEKNKGKKKTILTIIITAIITFTLFMMYGAYVVHQEEAQKQNREEQITEFLTYVTCLKKKTAIASIFIDMDSGKQYDVFKNNAYGDLNGAIEKYREDKETKKFQDMYVKGIEETEVILNGNILKVSDEIKEDDDIKELIELSSETYDKLLEFKDFVVAPYGNYITYNEKASELATEYNNVSQKLDTRLKYIAKSHNLDEEKLDELATEKIETDDSSTQ